MISTINFTFPKYYNPMNICEGSLPGLVSTADDLNKVLNYLNGDQITAVLRVLARSRVKLPKLIASAAGLSKVLRSLSVDKITTVLENLVGMGMLSQLIRSPEDIERLSSCLDEDQIALVRDSIQPDEALVLQGSVSQHSSLLSSRSSVYHFYKVESRHRDEGNTVDADDEEEGQAPQKAMRLDT